MSWTTGTQAADANPAQTFMATLNTLIDGHANWVFQETVTSGTNVADVYKCLGAGNSAGTDFYIAIRRTATTDTSITFALFESYTAGGTLDNFVPEVSNTSLNGCFNSPAGDGTTPLAAQNIFTTTHVMWIPLSTPLSSFPYWISLTADRIVLGTTTTFAISASGATTSLYAGCFEPFTGVTDPQPFVLCRFPGIATSDAGTGAAAAQWGGYTRMTIAPGASRRQNWMVSALPSSFAVLPSGIQANEQREPGSLKYHLSKIALGNRYSGDSNSSPFTQLQIRGWFKDCRGIVGAPNTHAKGDRYYDGTDYYVALGYENSATYKQIGAVNSSV